MPFTSPAVVVAAIVMVIIIARAVVIVPENHRGAIVRLGKYLKTLAPGFHIRVPVFDLVTKVDLDTSIPGWQGLSERDLDAAVESFVTFGSATMAKPVGNRPASRAAVSSGAPDAQALAAWLLKAASEQVGVDLSKDPMAATRIAERAQSAVEELRSSDSCEISLPFITADQTGPKHFAISLSKSQVEGIRSAERG